ncbi:response regulator [Paenibacillus sp. GSMTC-2017]|uniref:response regulator n=1 Tax=Paenibacillus sp. GSMTC-2017 TaxID=2794350 RepID=UPI0018D92D02|nr:response regulator [Paenibacillus sp. GSMTC-2017]MBH5320117.1 response regulator [Paenibacillus sp. GSMTC-2017]
MKLFFVDDEIIIRTGLSTVIPWADSGYEVLEPAASAEEAIARLEVEKPNIIVTDIQMTGLTGFDLASEVRRLLPESEVIILSGYDQFKYAQKAIRAGVSDYLLKTSRPDEIVKAVAGARQRIIMRGESLKRNHLRDEAMEGLLRGKELDDSTLMQAKVLLPKLMLHEPNGYLVIKIGASGWEEDSGIQKLLLFAVHNVISELIEGEAIIWDRTIVLIVRLNGGISSPIQLEYELAKIELKLKCKIYAGVGEFADGQKGLQKAYETAAYSYLFRGLLPHQKIITHDAIYRRKGGKIECSQTERDELALILAQRDETLLRKWAQEVYSQQRSNKDTTPQSLLTYLRSVNMTAMDFIKGSGSEIDFLPNSDSTTLEMVAINGGELLIERLLELLKDEQVSSEQSNIPHINRAISYIHEHLSESITLEDVADYVQLTNSHFGEVFHRETGQEFKEYLSKLRMERLKNIEHERGKS